MKKSFSLLLALVMLLSMFTVMPTGALAAKEASSQKLKVSATVSDKNTVKLSWKKKSVSGYNIYRSKANNHSYGKRKKIATIAGNKCTYVDKTVKYKEGYSYSVEAFSKKGKKNKIVYSGSCSVFAGLCNCEWDDYYPECYKKVSPDCITLICSAGMEGFMLPTGFEIYRADADENGNVTGKYKLIKTYKNNKKAYNFSYNDKTVETGKTYRYKARAYKTIKGKKVYGKYSYAIALTAVNSAGTYTVTKAPVDDTKPVELGITSDKNNGVTVFSPRGNKMGLIYEYSYDNVNWVKTEEQYSITLKANETIYIRLGRYDSNTQSIVPLTYSDTKNNEVYSYISKTNRISGLSGTYRMYDSSMTIDLTNNTAVNTCSFVD